MKPRDPLAAWNEATHPYGLLCLFLARDYPEFGTLLSLLKAPPGNADGKDISIGECWKNLEAVKGFLAETGQREFCHPEYSPLLADEPVMTRGKLCLEFKNRLEDLEGHFLNAPVALTA